MPEFIAETSGDVAGRTWDDLDPFTQGYLVAMLFTNTTSAISMVDWNDPDNVEDRKEGRADGELPADAGFSDIHPASLETAVDECAVFQRDNAKLLSAVLGHACPARIIGDGTLPGSHWPAWKYDAAAAGRDLWFTRCGHGAGFWDRNLGEAGDQLSEAAQAYGNRDATFGKAADGTNGPTGYGWIFIH